MKKNVAKAFEAAYRALVSLWQASFRWFPQKIKRVPARVISIGNITWGGTGKTPLTVKLARDLAEEGKKVAVLTRGYGKDESKELQSRLPGIPVLIGRDRTKTAREAVEKHGADVLLMDDGFQHLALHRDLDIVTLNATEPFGPGGMIPLGTLREPLENLARADIYILTKCDLGSKNVHWIRQKLNAIKPNAVIFEAVHRPVALKDPLKNRSLQPGDLRGRRVGVLSGIGDPYSFEKTVEYLGGEIPYAARYRDHHEFLPSELSQFVRRCQQLNLCEAVTTEKDYFRLRPWLERRLPDEAKAFTFWVLQIEFQVNDDEDFIRRCLHP